jgi:hypothetical protein
MRRIAVICVVLGAGCFYDYGKLQGRDAGNPTGVAGGGGGAAGTGGAIGAGGVAGGTAGDGGSGGGSGASGIAGTTGGSGGTGGSGATAGTGGTAGTAGAGGTSGRGGSAGNAGMAGMGGGGGTMGTAGMGGRGGTTGTAGAGGCGAGATGSGGSDPCAGLCSNPIVVPPNSKSDDLGTGTTCNSVLGTCGGNFVCENFVYPRTFTVNGTPFVCSGSFKLPAPRNGGWCLQAGAGNNSYADFITYNVVP